MCPAHSTPSLSSALQVLFHPVPLILLDSGNKRRRSTWGEVWTEADTTTLPLCCLRWPSQLVSEQPVHYSGGLWVQGQPLLSHQIHQMGRAVREAAFLQEERNWNKSVQGVEWRMNCVISDWLPWKSLRIAQIVPLHFRDANCSRLLVLQEYPQYKTFQVGFERQLTDDTNRWCFGEVNTQHEPIHRMCRAVGVGMKHPGQKTNWRNN